MKKISIDQFLSILALQEKHNPEFAHIYTRTKDPGEHLHFAEYIIEGDDKQQVHTYSHSNGLHLVFQDCQLPNFLVTSKVKSLVVHNCLLNFVEITAGKLEFAKFTGAIKLPQLTIVKSYVKHLELDVPVGQLSFNDCGSQSIIVMVASRSIDRLSFYVSKVQAKVSQVINFCEILNCEYPFVEYARIKNLEIRFLTGLRANIIGVFKTILIQGTCAPITLMDVACLSRLSFANADIGQHDSPDLLIKKAYIGTLRMHQTNCEILIRPNVKEQEAVFIDDCLFRNLYGKLVMQGSEISPVLCINRLNFQDYHIHSDQRVIIQDIFVQTLAFDHFTNAGNITFTGVAAGGFSPVVEGFDYIINGYAAFNLLRDIINKNNFQTERKEVLLRFSDLGKMNFINTNLSHFTLAIHSTKIVDISLVGSQLPKQLTEFKYKNYPEVIQQHRMAYAQLKKLHEQHGDQVAALHYFAQEMNAYYDGLRFPRDTWEILALGLNKISSNHGSNWIRALASTLIVSLLFYWWFCVTMGYSLGSPFDAQARARWYALISYFFEFINPLHKLENFQDINLYEKFSVGARIIDGISRIFIAYFIYQLIQAFRKHGKSK